MLRRFCSLLVLILVTSHCAYASGAFGKDGTSYSLPGEVVSELQLITGLNPGEISCILAEAEFGKLDNSVICRILGLIKAPYQDVAYFIADNYSSLAINATAEEKKVIDKYFIAYSAVLSEEYATTRNHTEAILDAIQHESIMASVSDTVANIKLFSTNSGASSMLNVSGHSWITVTNKSQTGITVGKMAIAPGKTVALGTWGNKNEHLGLWYNLESCFDKANSSNFAGRKSVNQDITSFQLSILNSFILNTDTWAYTYPCSSFAGDAFFAATGNMFYYGGLYSTPTILKTSIEGNWTHVVTTNASIPYDYLVHYANGSGSLTRSSIY